MHSSNFSLLAPTAAPHLIVPCSSSGIPFSDTNNAQPECLRATRARWNQCEGCG